MPIIFNKEEQRFEAVELSPEEINFFVELGRDELLKMMAIQMFKQFAEHQGANPLESIPKEQMGNA